jgi:hypothetical protein
MEIFSISRGAGWIIVDCSLILYKHRGLCVKLAGIIDFGIIFE